MGLVTSITRKVDVPHEAGAWLELRLLSWLRLEDARRKRMNALTETFKALGGLSLPSLNGGAPVVEDRLTSYDIGSLLRSGIVSWSYGAFSADQIEDLDEQTAKFAARELLRMSLPEEADLKASASTSTAT